MVALDSTNSTNITGSTSPLSANPVASAKPTTTNRATIANSTQNSSLAPIVLFTYNRPRHTRQTLEALIANPLAKKSELFIYQDAPRDNATQQQKASALEVTSYIQELIATNTASKDNTKAFQNITFIQREQNLGLADSIIDGVTTIVNRYGRVIVLEDDIVVSPVFLEYMNTALALYENEEKVWSISAWSYPIDTQGLGDCYFWRVPHCWGWATWTNRWKYFTKDITLTEFSQSDIAYINLDGVADFFSHFVLNLKGKLKTWAIFNYLVSYRHNALTLCPSVSYIKQIGFDNSGVHCGEEGNVLNPAFINTKFPITFPTEAIESQLALSRVKAFEIAQKKTLYQRVSHKIQRIFNKIYNKLLHFSS